VYPASWISFLVCVFIAAALMIAYNNGRIQLQISEADQIPIVCDARVRANLCNFFDTRRSDS
jgi:hypothetical protein